MKKIMFLVMILMTTMAFSTTDKIVFEEDNTQQNIFCKLKLLNYEKTSQIDEIRVVGLKPSEKTNMLCNVLESFALRSDIIFIKYE